MRAGCLLATASKQHWLAESHVAVASMCTVAVACVNNGSSASSQMNEITLRIWVFCVSNDLELRDKYLLGIEKVLADVLSGSLMRLGTSWKCLGLCAYQHSVRGVSGGSLRIIPEPIPSRECC